MTGALDFIKLALGLGAFAFIVVVGARSKRIAGVLLTFPTMNGIALLTTPDPFRVAQAIALIVVFNTLLFWSAVTVIRWVPPARTISDPFVLLVCRVLAWTAVWCLGAYYLTDYRDAFPSGMILFALQLVIVAAAACALWRPPAAAKAGPRRTFFGGALNWVVRIILFVIVYAALLYAARHAQDQKWTGMASALPIVGFFSLAALSTENTDEELRPIRDTVLLGPLLVIPFNWAFAWIVTAAPAGPWSVFHIAALVAAWAIALAFVFLLVPRFARTMDKRAAG